MRPILACLVLLVSCRSSADGDAAPRSGAPASGSPAPAPSGPPAAASTAGGVARPPVDVCRAVAVRGTVTGDQGLAIATNASLDAAPWLTLAADSVLVVKHARTTREVTVEGPGRVRPCHERGEAFLLASGTLRSTAGAGARAGAEVSVATPQGVVRYADAQLSIQVTPGAVVLGVRTGTAWFDPPGEAATIAVSSGQDTKHNGPSRDVKTLASACKAAAQQAAEAGRAVLDKTTRGEQLSARAGLHFKARLNARKACGIAAAALGLLDEGPELAALRSELDRAASLWRALPGDDKSSNNANFR